MDTILSLLDALGEISDTNKTPTINKTTLSGDLNALERRQMIEYSSIDKEILIPTTEGSLLINQGSHEAVFFNSIPDSGIEISSLSSLLGPAYAFGQAKAFKNKWVKKNGSLLLKNVVSIVDQTRLDLISIQQGSPLNDETIKDLVKRRLIEKMYYLLI